jgi:hypothetical protein
MYNDDSQSSVLAGLFPYPEEMALAPILSQNNPVNVLMPCFFKTPDFYDNRTFNHPQFLLSIKPTNLVRHKKISYVEIHFSLEF